MVEMFEFIILILAVSLVFYVVFAGADFGAGIYELLCLVSGRKSQKDLVEKAIGPIWEANHMWLILAVVIYFMGFPKAFSTFTNIFHIPLTMVLIGISIRGTAFAFRHYDPIQDGWQTSYSWLFGISSLWTAFWQGIIVGGLFGILPAHPAGFYETYISSWLSPFSVAVGFFVCSVYLFLAQTFFIAETSHDLNAQKIIRKDVWRSLSLVLVAGAIVFMTSWFSHPYFIKNFFSGPIGIVCMVLTTLLMIPLIISYRSPNAHWARWIVSFQVGLIFLAVFTNHYPSVLVFSDGSIISYTSSMAPDATITQLFYALLVGIIIVFPFLIYLIYLFKKDQSNHP
jgi:cytochrome bd ubiquinol oxidase subunit II